MPPSTPSRPFRRTRPLSLLSLGALLCCCGLLLLPLFGSLAVSAAGAAQKTDLNNNNNKHTGGGGGGIPNTAASEPRPAHTGSGSNASPAASQGAAGGRDLKATDTSSTTTTTAPFASASAQSKCTFDSCDDGQPCTQDWCDSVEGCKFAHAECAYEAFKSAPSLRQQQDVIIAIEQLDRPHAAINCSAIRTEGRGVLDFVARWLSPPLLDETLLHTADAHGKQVFADDFVTLGGTPSESVPDIRFAIVAYGHHDGPLLLLDFTSNRDAIANVISEQFYLPALQACFGAGLPGDASSQPGEDSSDALAQQDHGDALDRPAAERYYEHVTLPHDESEADKYFDSPAVAVLDTIRRVIQGQPVRTTVGPPSGSSRAPTGETYFGFRMAAEPHLVVLSGFTRHSSELVSADEKILDTVFLQAVQAAADLPAFVPKEILPVAVTTSPLAAPSVSVILNGHHKTMLDVFGDPRHVDAYPNHDQFNFGATLRSLIAAGSAQGSSLMAYFLSKDRYLRVWTLNQLAQNFAQIHLLPGALQPRFPSKLQVNRCISSGCVPTESRCDLLALQCQDNEFCSPIHGCVGLEYARSEDEAAAAPAKFDVFEEYEDVQVETGQEEQVEEGPDGKPVTVVVKKYAVQQVLKQSVNKAEEKPHYSVKKATFDLSPESVQAFVPTVDYILGRQWTIDHIAYRQVRVLDWTPTKSFIRKFKRLSEPLILRNTVVSTWPAAKKWNLKYLAEALSAVGPSLSAVKRSPYKRFYDPDPRAPLARFMNLTTTYEVLDLPTAEFFHKLIESTPSLAASNTPSGEDIARIGAHAAAASESERRRFPDGLNVGHAYFTKIPASLLPDVQSSEPLFFSADDEEIGNQFLWISSAGCKTHTHFDQDMNAYVQLVGHKRFTFFIPSEHELMYMFPRIHPMWHKSRVDFDAPDLQQFPLYRNAHAIRADLRPGDLLLVPPYTWHHVHSLTASVSMSTWSHDFNVYSNMRAVYRHDHMFDTVVHPRGKLFSFRLYLELLTDELYGANSVTEFVAKLLRTRFLGLEHLFPPSPDDEAICHGDKEPGRQIPSAQHIAGYCNFDVRVMAPHFKAFAPETRDILFRNYVEELAAEIVGARRVYAFFRYCFNGETFYMTSPSEPEHRLWDA